MFAVWIANALNMPPFQLETMLVAQTRFTFAELTRFLN